jgi:hypothetical protein
VAGGVSSLPADVARCNGVGSFENGEQHWREGCDAGSRRSATGYWGWIDPPAIIAFECKRRITPGNLPSASPS